MQAVIVAALQYILTLQFVQGYRTALGGVAMIAGGVAKLFADPPDITTAVGMIGAGIAVIGHRHQDQEPSDVIGAIKTWMTKK